MHVAIIGAGAAGLSIALTLRSRNIKCTIYESKEAPYRGLGALMLAPNALRILDSLGLYSQLRSRGFNFSNIEFRDECDLINDVWQMGNQDKYGYDALRITRPIFLDVLRAAVDERGIEVKYSTKYSHVVDETAQGVTFQLVDGEQITTDILVGADGVYSDVRKHIAPDIQPRYSGNLALLATVKHRFAHSDPKTSHNRPPQTTFYYGDGGGPASPQSPRKNASIDLVPSNSNAMLILPQGHDGSSCCLGTQRKYPEQSREDWVHLGYNKDKLYNILTSHSDNWPPRVQEALSKVDKNDIFIWPFYALPELPSWTSLPHRRTILLGDAAHSVPPTAGQNACSGIEDAYTLAMMISTLSRANVPADSLARSIATWQTARQERVAKARAFTKQVDNNRLPQSEKEKLPKGTYWERNQHPDLSWLYGAGLANSNAKGVTRVEVKKEDVRVPPTARPGSGGDAGSGNTNISITRVRAATVDSAYGIDQRRQPIGSEEVVRGAC